MIAIELIPILEQRILAFEKLLTKSYLENYKKEFRFENIEMNFTFDYITIQSALNQIYYTIDVIKKPKQNNNLDKLKNVYSKYYLDNFNKSYIFSICDVYCLRKIANYIYENISKDFETILIEFEKLLNKKKPELRCANVLFALIILKT